ncbi:hypothetical protein EIP91_010436 [Steccherinum ochraceum]|uniref:Uncharacterized protein n=1 Tax=Steccherinum ochraceum TaxID=92696 RepID=A0A4R0R0M0_9APHY|nr:hypothetical protein EIP91_010436 [Steccherinum ochraceum]
MMPSPSLADQDIHELAICNSLLVPSSEAEDGDLDSAMRHVDTAAWPDIVHWHRQYPKSPSTVIVELAGVLSVQLSDQTASSPPRLTIWFLANLTTVLSNLSGSTFACAHVIVSPGPGVDRHLWNPDVQGPIQDAVGAAWSSVDETLHALGAGCEKDVRFTADWEWNSGCRCAFARRLFPLSLKGKEACTCDIVQMSLF